MNHHEKVEHLKELARQLRCPEGDEGIQTGEHMNVNNAGMTARTLEKLHPAEQVLEIGPGNAQHAAQVLEKVKHYYAVDISETMVTEARQRNAVWIEQGRVRVEHIDGQHLPFSDAFFDEIFTVNTIYFWPEPLAYLEEMHRCLKPGGRLVLAFATQEFMQHLPFTQYGFEMYATDTVEELLTSVPFTILDVHQEDEEILSNAGHAVVRTFVVVSAQK
ncbi:hypothetical protein BWI97_23425 [Siphonobacter sp. BAB-5405]|uniref:class I SAM-dependent methyltransferase n=1 Tax=Siphonobacter sp. BAB-5405 TaxID=1864825 RepID=UPI000C810576|nr:class I SAM-dependent methyltransferase [Siphonobacter sp. BAB-5405]PMD90433.1 hypothetical protein BWI97_23425 [Siphonobacter sp. BAB-5405]